MVDLLEVPLRAAGGFFAMSADTLRAVFSRPFQRREFVDQAWFVARVSMVPTVLVAIPFTVLVSFTINILLREIGAADLSGAGAALGAVTQVGPIVTVLIVAGAGATAICADLAARTIREEIDAMRVLGINPIPASWCPVSSRRPSSPCCSTVSSARSVSSAAPLLGVRPGRQPGCVRQRDHAPHRFRRIDDLDAQGWMFGMIAGLMAAYLGMNVRGGAKSVGDAVNQTVVFSFMALFVVNVLVTLSASS